MTKFSASFLTFVGVLDKRFLVFAPAQLHFDILFQRA